MADFRQCGNETRRKLRILVNAGEFREHSSAESHFKTAGGDCREEFLGSRRQVPPAAYPSTRISTDTPKLVHFTIRRCYQGTVGPNFGATLANPGAGESGLERSSRGRASSVRPRPHTSVWARQISDAQLVRGVYAPGGAYACGFHSLGAVAASMLGQCVMTATRKTRRAQRCESPERLDTLCLFIWQHHVSLSPDRIAVRVYGCSRAHAQRSGGFAIRAERKSNTYQVD